MLRVVGGLRRRVAALCLALAGMLLSLCTGAFALNPKLDISQYAHTTWKVRDGSIKGAIFAIAQTTDGYLWLGTESGLMRFDGVRTVPWQPPTGEQLPHNFITALLVSHDGILWIGTYAGLASWRDGKFRTYQEFTGASVLALIEDHEGTVWIGSGGFPGGNLCAAKGGQIQCYGGGSFGSAVRAVYEDRKGNLWVSAKTGLWRWKPGSPEHFTLPRGVGEARGLTEDDGTILISTNMGLLQLVSGKIKSYVLPGVAGEFQAGCLFQSSDGSLWVGSYQGLLHLHQGRADVFKADDGLSANFIFSIFEDREGSVWVSTPDGLDRFRDVAIPTISRQQGLSSSQAWSVDATPDGSLWIGTAEGLNRWQNGHVSIYRSRTPLGESHRDERGIGGRAREIVNSGLLGTPQALGHDQRGRLWASTDEGVFYFENDRFIRVPGIPGVYTAFVVGDGEGNVWISNGAGLYRLAPGLAVQHIPWSQFGHGPSLVLLSDPRQGGFWLGFAKGGIAYFKDRKVQTSYSDADGLGKGLVSGLRFGSRGTLWAATEGGLSRIKDGHITTLTSKNGLPCDAVHWSMEDDDHSVWLYMPCGLVRVTRPELDAWVTDPKHIVQTTVFDSSDGVRTLGIASGYFPAMTKSPDGRIWFLPRDGVSLIDPRHFPFNTVPPPVHIEQIIADHSRYEAASNASGNVPLPPLIRDLEIDYTALSLAVPEKVRFRYKLEDWDHDWQEAGTRRQAFYSNLPPRSYTFRVMACNNSGVWNEAGAALRFSVAAAYYQTLWFRALCVAAVLGLALALYRLRLRQLARQYNLRLEERVSERTRIARDLHDTLLQSFQGVLLKFHAIRYIIPDRPDEACKALDTTVEQAREAITEGRDAVQGLRSSIVLSNNFAAELSVLGDELAHRSDGSCPHFRVVVEGTPRELALIVCEESYRITGEAVRNAFLHSQANRIEVEVRYGSRVFRLRVRDDGKGIDPKILEAGRDGHYGLTGMRERARLVGGKLAIWSELDSGTEAELTVPAAVAYAKTSPKRRAPFWRKGA